VKFSNRRSRAREGPNWARCSSSLKTLWVAICSVTQRRVCPSDSGRSRVKVLRVSSTRPGGYIDFWKLEECQKPGNTKPRSSESSTATHATGNGNTSTSPFRSIDGGHRQGTDVPLHSLGKVVWESREFDSALINLLHWIPEHKRDGQPQLAGSDDHGYLLPLDDYMEHIEYEPQDAAVLMVDASGRSVSGEPLGSSSYMRLPWATTFQEVFTARASEPLMPGDSGCWVRDGASGKLYGHVVAGSPKTGLVVIIPARNMLPKAAVGMMLAEIPNGNVNNHDVNGWTLLCLMAAKGREDLIRVLLREGADVQQTNIRGETPLYLAVDRGHEAVVSLLLSHGAHITTANRHGDTPVRRALAMNHRAILDLLYRMQAPSNTRSFKRFEATTQFPVGSPSLSIASMWTASTGNSSATTRSSAGSSSVGSADRLGRQDQTLYCS
jgi:hypothetical protein